MHESFDLNPEVNHDNKAKHDLSLTEAEAVFTDPYLLSELYDEEHSESEERYYVIGILPSGKMIKVNYTMRDGCGNSDDMYRLITAREATREEKRQYCEHLKTMLGL